MNRKNVIVLLIAEAFLFAAPALVYPMLPPEFFDVFGSLNGFRLVAMAYLLGLVGAEFGTYRNQPSEEDAEPKPEKKLHLKRKEEPDDKLAAMKAAFTARQDPPPAKPVEEQPKQVEFDLDKEYKLAMIKLANQNGVQKVEEKPPTYEELLAEWKKKAGSQ
jgi:hypothetical protein